MRLKINDLMVRTTIGVFDWEKQHKREVIINLTLDIAAEKSAVTDNLQDTLDYFQLTQKIIDALEPNTFNLIETVAQTVFNITIAEPMVKFANVSVQKPGFPRYAKSAEIIIEGNKNL